MRFRLRTATVLSLLAASAAAAALPAAAAGAGAPEPAVRVATSGNRSERISSLPITRHPGAEERVAISMSPAQLPGLKRGDRLQVSAELQVTLDCLVRVRRCVGEPYSYNPQLRTRLVLARSAHSTSGPGALRIGRELHSRCRGTLPYREHHCVLVLDGAALDVGPRRTLPCKPTRCRVNLVLGASSPHARPGELLLVGGNRPDGSIPQDRGRINVVRHRGTSPADARAPSTRKRRYTSLPPDKHRRVVYSLPLRGLQRGQQLEIRGALRTSAAGLPYDVRTTTQLILADRADAKRSGPLARHVGTLHGEVTESNGFNCVRIKPACRSRRVGVLRIRRNAVRDGRREKLFVNFVALLGPKRRAADPGDRVPVLDGGGIRVLRYPKRLEG